MKTQEYINQSQDFNFGYMLREQRLTGALLKRFEIQIDAFSDLFPDKELTVDAYSITLNHPEREEMLAFIKCFGGDWEKTVAEYDNTKINYEQKIDDRTSLKVCYCAPPPSCKIVEEEVEVPAQEARKEMRKRIVCKEEQEGVNEQ